MSQLTLIIGTSSSCVLAEANPRQHNGLLTYISACIYIAATADTLGASQWSVLRRRASGDLVRVRPSGKFEHFLLEVLDLVFEFLGKKNELRLVLKREHVVVWLKSLVELIQTRHFLD